MERRHELKHQSSFSGFCVHAPAAHRNRSRLHLGREALRRHAEADRGAAPHVHWHRAELAAFAQSGKWPVDRSLLFGWPGGRKPSNAVDVDDDVVMSAWANRSLVFGVMVDPHNDRQMH
jgi:hypothetical protein